MNSSKFSSRFAKIALLVLLTLTLIPPAATIIPPSQTYGTLQQGSQPENLSLSSIAPTYDFGIISSTQEEPAIRNFYWLLGNESISYDTLLPSEIATFTALNSFAGLIIWTKQGGYNASAIRQFAQTHIVIADTRDFCKILYPTLSSSLQIVTNDTAVYNVNWGNFHSGDVAEMRNETGNSDKLTGVLTTSLKNFSNITRISQFDSSRTASFFMNGTQPKSGFYVMDLDATTLDTMFTGIWHVFPAVKMVHDFPTGTYSEWMADGTDWWNLAWVYNRVDTIVNNSGGVAQKMVIGHSVQGRNIVAIIIGTGRQNAIVDGAIHGNEKTGPFACLRIAELLIQYYRSDPYWRSKLAEYKVIIVPVVNPDGFVANSRENANGVNLNRQFPPDGTTTEPEAWALRNLMGNYTPTVYVNIHEGAYYYPNYMIYGAYLSGTSLTLTKNALQMANQTFAGLKEYGWYTDGGANAWVGKAQWIGPGGGEPGMASDYASYAYDTSSTILETFLWSQTYGARQCLWGLDYYPAVFVAFLEQHMALRFEDGFESGSFSAWNGTSVTPGETVTVTQTLPFLGRYSARFASNGTGGSEAAYCYESVPTSSRLYAGGYFYVSKSGITQNDDRFYFIEFLADGNEVAYAGIRRTDGVDKWYLIIRDGTDWAIAYSSFSASLNDWHNVELYWTESSSTGHGELYVDGTLACSLQNQNTTAFGGINEVRFGLPRIYETGSTTIYADSCRILGTLPWDINQDGTVNVLDLTILAHAFGSTPGSKKWNPAADINADGNVDITDLVAVALHFGPYS